MQKKAYIITTFLIFVFVETALAHPSGNFSINQYSHIEIGKSQIKLRAVLDMAEIPTFQQSQAIDADSDSTLSEAELNAYAASITPDYIANLLLTINDRAIQLRQTAKSIALKNGSGDLRTLVIKWDLIGDLPAFDANAIQRAQFENKNYEGRIGWNEIVAGRVGGINIFNSTAFGNSLTNELEAYPGDVLTEMLNERKAEFFFTSAPLSANVKPLQNRDGHVSAPIEKDGFAELITVPEMTLPIILLGLIIAFGFGAMHAMSPGHGKTVVGAYLVGSRGTPKHALFLGATVTLTHTISVFALGIIALLASEYILPEKMMPFLSLVSGLLVLFIGINLFKDRLLIALGQKSSLHHHHDHIHHHDHHERGVHSHEDDDHHHAHGGLTHTHGDSTHTHLPPEKISWRNLLALGISGGLIPCPSALVLMLSAISLNRIGYGLVLTAVFSFGLAATLTAVGLAFLYVGKFFDNPKLSGNRIVKALPVFSAFVISCVGAVICYNSLFKF